MKDISTAWFEDLQSVLAHESVTVPDVRIGVFYTAARLSTGRSEERRVGKECRL